MRPVLKLPAWNDVTSGLFWFMGWQLHDQNGSEVNVAVVYALYTDSQKSQFLTNNCNLSRTNQGGFNLTCTCKCKWLGLFNNRFEKCFLIFYLKFLCFYGWFAYDTCVNATVWNKRSQWFNLNYDYVINDTDCFQLLFEVIAVSAIL